MYISAGHRRYDAAIPTHCLKNQHSYGFVVNVENALTPEEVGDVIGVLALSDKCRRLN